MTLRRIRPLWRRALAICAVAGLLGGTLVGVLLSSAGPDAPPLSAPPQAATAASVTAPSGPLDPAGYGPDGCVALNPLAGDRQRTVFLDAGHGGPDPGASGDTPSGESVDESELTLPVALAAADLLRARGYRVVLSRVSDTAGIRLTPADLSDGALSTAGNHAQLVGRVRCANLAGAAALVSIHFNSYDDSGVRGFTTLYDPDRPFADSNERLATLVHRQIERAFTEAGHRARDLGVSPDNATEGGEQTSRGESYGHPILLGPAATGYNDEPTRMPGTLIEPLFITNPTEAGLAASPAGRQALGDAIAQGVDQFLQQG